MAQDVQAESTVALQVSSPIQEGAVLGMRSVWDPADLSFLSELQFLLKQRRIMTELLRINARRDVRLPWVGWAWERAGASSQTAEGS